MKFLGVEIWLGVSLLGRNSLGGIKCFVDSIASVIQYLETALILKRKLFQGLKLGTFPSRLKICPGKDGQVNNQNIVLSWKKSEHKTGNYLGHCPGRKKILENISKPLSEIKFNFSLRII